MNIADLIESQQRIKAELLDPKRIEERKELAREDARRQLTTFNRQCWERGTKRPDPRFRGDEW